MGWWLLGVGLGLLAVHLLLSFKTSRSDGELIRLHPYRRIMLYIMPTRNESAVYFDAYVDARRLLPYVKQARERFDADITHCAVAACAIGLASTPSMNRFTIGRRMYQRRGRWVSFAMKRKHQDRKAKLATVKIEAREGETFRELCERINGDIRLNRSGKKTAADKEFQLFDALPRPVMEPATRIINWMNYNNLLPAFFIKDDPLHTSMFVANLGSLDMDPGYHHLYEYGTCPLFLMVGRLHDRPVVVDGEVQIIPSLHLRFTYDERIDDGLNARFGIESVVRVLNEPDVWLGCVEEDGSDDRPMWPRQDWATEDGRFQSNR